MQAAVSGEGIVRYWEVEWTYIRSRMESLGIQDNVLDESMLEKVAVIFNTIVRHEEVRIYLVRDQTLQLIPTIFSTITVQKDNRGIHVATITIHNKNNISEIDMTGHSLRSIIDTLHRKQYELQIAYNTLNKLGKKTIHPRKQKRSRSIKKRKIIKKCSM